MIDATADQKALALKLEAQQLQVVDEQSYQYAATVREAAVTFIAERKEYWKEPKAKASAAHKEICEMERADIGPAEQVKELLGPRMAAYQEQQEQARRLAEAQALAASKKLSEDAVLATAEALEASGDRQGATDVLEAPLVAQVVPVGLPAAPKMAGTHFRGKFTLTITDKDALVADLMANPALRHIVVPDEGKLKEYVKSTDGKPNLRGLNVTVGLTTVTKRRRA